MTCTVAKNIQNTPVPGSGTGAMAIPTGSCSETRRLYCVGSLVSDCNAPELGSLAFEG